MITPPPLVKVNPGDPITSEGMNNLLSAVSALYDFLNKQRGTLTVNVTNQGTNNAVPGAVVTVKPTGDTTRPTRSAVYAGSNVNAYLVDQILPGPYDVVVEAVGFNPATQSITMPDSGNPLTVSVALSVTEVRLAVPGVLGVGLAQALGRLTAAGFGVARIIDSSGKDIPPGNVPTEAQALPVLGQWPPQDALAPKSAPFFLQVAAAAGFVQQVTVPDLSNLTLNQATAVLQANKLVLGTTVIDGVSTG